MAVTNGEVQKKKPGKGKKIIILLLILLVPAAISTYYFLGKADTEGAKTVFAKKDKENYEIMSMGSLVVNLKDQGVCRYLRVSPVLQYAKNSKLADELNEKKYLLEDSMITCLRSKTFSEVRPVESVEDLKEDLKEIINSNLSQGKIEGIYFVEYLLN